METIWTYLDSLGIKNSPRTEKKTVHLALESGKLNPTQLGRMAKEGFLSEKLDGVYSLVTYIRGEVRHWGRSGKAQCNCEALDKDLERRLKDAEDPCDYVFISEVTSEDPLAKLSGYLNPNRVNESSFNPTNMKDNFHDMLYLHEFIVGVAPVSFMDRQGFLWEALEPIGIEPVQQIICSYDQARSESLEWIKQGKEGGVFAQDVEWVAGARNETLIKVKEKLSYDVTVVGVCSGKEGSKYEHTLGKLVVAFRAFGDPNGALLEIPISGMTDAQRKEWWEHPGLIVSGCVKMNAKSFTETGNLREPVFGEERHDKSSEFPVEVLEETRRFTKGKAGWIVHQFK